MTLSLLDLLEGLDDRLVRQAFTHASLVGDRGRSYERLEFLGDSVLSLCITGELYRRYPQYTEGHLARLRAYVVSRETCAKVATTLDFGRQLVRRAPSDHDADEVRQLAANANVLADLTEAVIGALYITFGFETVRPAVVEAFEEHIVFAERSHVDNKTQLQEILAKSARTVTYRTVGQTGPAHDRHFEVEAVVADEVLGRGHGQSKKRAEQMAAGEALEELRRRERPPRERKVRLLARRRKAPAPDGSAAPDGAAPAQTSSSAPPPSRPLPSESPPSQSPPAGPAAVTADVVAGVEGPSPVGAGPGSAAGEAPQSPSPTAGAAAGSRRRRSRRRPADG